MRIGSARVSTPEQSYALQRDALEQSGCTKIFQEVARRLSVKKALDEFSDRLLPLMGQKAMIAWL